MKNKRKIKKKFKACGRKSNLSVKLAIPITSYFCAYISGPFDKITVTIGTRMVLPRSIWTHYITLVMYFVFRVGCTSVRLISQPCKPSAPYSSRPSSLFKKLLSVTWKIFEVRVILFLVCAHLYEDLFKIERAFCYILICNFTWWSHLFS